MIIMLKSLFHPNHFAILIAAVMLSSCDEKQQPDSVPVSGQAKYEIHYSSELRNNPLTGAVLPDKIVTRYNSDGLHFQMVGKLNTFSIDFVTTTTHSFFAMQIDKDKYVVPLEQMVEVQEAQDFANNLAIQETDSLVEVGGWMSKNVSMQYQTPFGLASVNAYYVPMESDGRELADMPIKKIPGMITAMNIDFEEVNVMFSLVDLQPDSVSNEEFAIPAGYVTTSPDEMLEVIQKLTK